MDKAVYQITPDQVIDLENTGQPAQKREVEPEPPPAPASSPSASAMQPPRADLRQAVRIYPAPGADNMPPLPRAAPLCLRPDALPRRALTISAAAGRERPATLPVIHAALPIRSHPRVRAAISRWRRRLRTLSNSSDLPIRSGGANAPPSDAGAAPSP